MSLSRAAKQFRDQMPQKKSGPAKPADAKQKAKSPPAQPATPAPPSPPPVEPVKPVEPTPGPEAVTPAEVAEVTAAAAPAKKVWPAKAKRPRFMRERAQKRERASGPALPSRSTKFTARLLTKNLVPPPAGEQPEAGR